MPDSKETYARITKVLVQALGVEEEGIIPSATMQGDLGAESIDFLDIVFRLEREFMIKIPHGEFLSALVFQDESEILHDGQVTKHGLATLRSRMPYADFLPLERDCRLNRIYDLFTVDLFSSYITWKLGESGESSSIVRAASPPRGPERIGQFDWELIMIAQLTSHCGSPSERRAGRVGSIARARRTTSPRLRYVDHPSFDDPTARDAILAPLTDSVDDRASRRVQSRVWLNRLPAGRARATFLSREEEAHLFRKMNFLKCRASQLEQQLDPHRPNPGDLDEIERLECEAQELKNRIVETHLRLVVSIAKTHAKVGYDMCECVSDGNLALLQAVDGFDFAKGNRFSTYATRAIQNVLTRNEWKFMRRRGYSLDRYEDCLAAPDSRLDEHEDQEVQNRRRSAVWRWLGQLDKREQRILASRYGIGGTPRLTLMQIGMKLGISKERVRQIVTRAQVKLRKFAELDALEPLEI